MEHSGIYRSKTKFTKYSGEIVLRAVKKSEMVYP